ncbi:MAG: hypothetical protein Q7T71_12335, partial [Herbiconiux sp.]|nr:hypothetical protein [Herbiconiux sp.]
MSSIEVHEIATAAEGPYGVAVTDDGAVWCTLVHAGVVVRRAPSGVLTRIPLPALAVGPDAPHPQPSQVAAAGDDTVWVTDTTGDRVLLLGPGGVLRSVDAPAGTQPFGVVSTHDGTAWFTGMGTDTLGRIGILGGVASFASGTLDGLVSMIAASGDSLWFTANQANVIGYVRGGDASPELFPVPTPQAGPVGIVVGDDGAAWFCEILADRIGRVDRQGNFTEFPLPSGSSKPHAIVRDLRASSGAWLDAILGFVTV